jgi:hypothetical protein
MSDEKGTEKWTYQKWYEKNKEGHNERRRERYHNDPAYRAKALERARDYRARRKVNRGS